MLKADLNFYADARWTAGARLGTILLLHKVDKSYVGFITARGFKAATIDVEDPVLRNIFKEMVPFLVRLGSAHHASERELAEHIANGLPHNIRMSDPVPWPPDKIEDLIVSAADEDNSIQLFSVPPVAPATPSLA